MERPLSGQSRWLCLLLTLTSTPVFADHGLGLDELKLHIPEFSAILLLLGLLLFGLVWVMRNTSSDPLAYQFSSRRGQILGVLAFTVVTSLVAIAVNLANHEIERRNKQTYQAILTNLRDATHERLTLWVNNEEERLNQITTLPDLITLAERRNRYSRDDVVPTSPDDELRFQQFIETYAPDLKAGYQIIDRGYNVLASDTLELNGQKSELLDHAHDALTRVFGGETVFVPPFKLHLGSSLSEQESASYIIAPIYDRYGSVIAALAKFEPPNAAFSQLYVDGRIGLTGETYAFNSSGLMVSNSRFSADLQQMGLLSPGQSAVLNIELRVPTDGSPLSYSAERALAGEEGVNVDGYIDYRGVEVIGAWYWDSDLNIGILSEVDVSEAYGTYYGSRRALMFVAAFTLGLTLLSVLGSFFIGHRANRVLSRSRNELEELVTERTDELRQREENFRGLFESSRDAIFLLGYGQIIDVNQAALALCEADSLEQLKSQPLHDLFPEFEQHILGESDAQSQEWRVFTVSGKEKYCEVSRQNSKWQGRTVVQLSARDISQAKQQQRLIQDSEYRLKLATENAGLAIWQYDVDQQGINASTLFWEMMELAPDDPSPTRGWLSRVADDDQQTIRDQLARLTRGEDEECQLRYRYRLADRTIWLYSFAKVHQRQDNGMASSIVGINQDISAQQFAQQQLEENRQQLDMALTGANAGMWDWDIKQQTLVTNSTWASMLGYQEQELSQRYGEGLVKWRALLHPEDYPEFEYSLQAYVLEDQGNYRKEFRMLASNGEWRWVLVLGTALDRDARGHAGRLLGITLDVTETKQLQLQLEDSRRQAEQASRNRDVLINSNPGMVYTCQLDEHWTMQYISAAAKDITGYPADHFVNNAVRSYGSIILDEYQQLVDDTVEKAVKEHNTFTVEYQIQRADGEERWVYEKGQATYAADGTPELLHGSIIDITDRKEAEQRARGILESAPDCMVVVDNARNITLVNVQTEKLFGYSQEELLGEKIEILLPLGNRPGHADHVKSFFEQPRTRQMGSGLELYARRKDGSTFPVEISLSPFETKTGLLVCAAVRDVTLRKQAEQELKQAKEEAESATQAKSDFLANMSHEIRTPMNAIIGMSHLALQTDLNKKQRNYIEKVNISAESLLRIINDILDFSKIEAGKLTMEQVDFHLDHVISQFSSLVGLRAAEKSLELLVDVDKEVPRGLIGDPLRLNQIFVNLGSNAVKFTEQGEVRLNIKVLEKDAEQVRLQFSVSDTGIGMSAQQQQHLFKSFSQADTSTTRKFGGTGLGLAISKQLSEMMNGKIWVESEEGKGSVFCFTAEFGINDSVEQQVLVLPENLINMRVLVVDDNPGARQILAELVESLGFEVDSAESADEALQLFSSPGGHQLALIDWKMPMVDGIALSQQLIDQNKQLKIIMVTAYDKEELQRSLDERGCQVAGVLTKPMTASDVFDGVLEAFGVQSSNLNLPAPTGETLRFDEVPLMLVEDNPLNQELAMELLEARGFNVTLAENGQEAIDKLEQHSFAAILMDCQMPVMDGYTATRKIRELEAYQSLPIIAMTANVMAKDIEETHAAGMNDHIGKPLNIESMFATIAKWVKPTGTEGATTAQAETTANFNLIDHEEALARLQGNQPLFDKMLRRFNENMADALEQYMESDDAKEAERLAHTLKGLSATIGAHALAEFAAQFEQIAEQASGKPQVDEALLDDAQSCLAETLAEIANYLSPQADAATNEPAQIDSEAFVRLFQQACQQLDDFDSEAIETMQEMEMHTPVELRPSLRQALASAEVYDFEEALTQLRPLVDSLGH
ncbi:PAS domain S-box protein [Aliagarivorans marinus]|uniref:PAS domain S-box protein n=1 Tax=Aliagarivorans marinus TaxID=561965 RepID=UPI000416A2EB|nr:PAS domain S-box protein [Aliagarivorans marinus]